MTISPDQQHNELPAIAVQPVTKLHSPRLPNVWIPQDLLNIVSNISQYFQRGGMFLTLIFRSSNICWRVEADPRGLYFVRSARRWDFSEARRNEEISVEATSRNSWSSQSELE